MPNVPSSYILTIDRPCLAVSLWCALPWMLPPRAKERSVLLVCLLRLVGRGCWLEAKKRKGKEGKERKGKKRKGKECRYLYVKGGQLSVDPALTYLLSCQLNTTLHYTTLPHHISKKKKKKKVCAELSRRALASFLVEDKFKKFQCDLIGIDLSFLLENSSFSQPVGLPFLLTYLSSPKNRLFSFSF